MVELPQRLMAQKKQLHTNWLSSTALNVTRIHFFYIVAFMVSIVVFDSWNLITPEGVTNFWTAISVLLVLNVLFWYLARLKFANQGVYRVLILLLVVADIVFAALTVYWERGLASSSVVLFAIPIITAATLRSRSAILASAALSAAAYSLAAVRYFYQHYGESFRVELYGEIGLYSAVFFVLAGLLLVTIRSAPSSS